MLVEIKSSYGKDAFKGSIESVTAMLPSRGVQVNDVWKNSLNMGPSMPGIINNTFTLSEVSDEYLIITGSSLIKINGTSQVDPYGLPTRYNMSGKKNSKIKIDPVTNWIIEAEYDQEFSGVSETSTRANILGGQDTPMSIKMRIEIQR